VNDGLGVESPAEENVPVKQWVYQYIYDRLRHLEIVAITNALRLFPLQFFLLSRDRSLFLQIRLAIDFWIHIQSPLDQLGIDTFTKVTAQARNWPRSQTLEILGPISTSEWQQAT
jgi:hypothetical protein